MARTTPPRPVNVEAAFPELRSMRRRATRLHPRHGEPTVRTSSVGGPLLWPADEQWPVCDVPHKRSSGYRLADVLREREILDHAWSRRPETGPTEEDREILATFKRGRHAPHLGATHPIPMLAVAQLYASEVPQLPCPDGTDLLQVFWCPFEKHGEEHQLNVHLRWRDSKEVREVVTDQPAPEVVGRDELVPTPCTLAPEEIVEYPYLFTLDTALQERIADWEGPEDEEGPQYIYDLSTAPGWKVGGYTAWPLTGPTDVRCTCGAETAPLLTVDKREWDPATTSWVPLEDRDSMGRMFANVPTGVSPGRGQLTVAVCSRDILHPHKLITQ